MQWLFSIQQLNALSMWYVHTEYTLQNAIASHFFEDVTTYLQSQGILGSSTLKISVSHCLTSQAS